MGKRYTVEELLTTIRNIAWQTSRYDAALHLIQVSDTFRILSRCGIQTIEDAYSMRVALGVYELKTRDEARKELYNDRISVRGRVETGARVLANRRH